MATIRKRKNDDGDVSYQVQIRKKGSAPVAKTFKRLEDAKRWARDAEAKIERGIFFADDEATRRTLGEAIDRYMKEVDHGKDTRNRKRQLEWWKEEYGALTLSQITPAALSQAKTDLQRGDGRKRTGATVNRYLAALSHCLTICEREWQWVSHNPLRRVQRLKEPPGRVRYLSDDERIALLDACDKSTKRNLPVIVRLALCTGARRGELESLVWSQVDLKKKSILLHETKNGERRALYLAKPALLALEKHGKVRHIGTDYVFPHDDGLRPDTIEMAWRTAKKAAKLDNFKFHDLRHTAGSYLAMNGASIMDIAAALGHKTVAMVKRYSHLSDSHIAGVMERMAEKMGGQV